MVDRFEPSQWLVRLSAGGSPPPDGIGDETKTAVSGAADAPASSFAMSAAGRSGANSDRLSIAPVALIAVGTDERSPSTVCFAIVDDMSNDPRSAKATHAPVRIDNRSTAPDKTSVPCPVVGFVPERRPERPDTLPRVVPTDFTWSWPRSAHAPEVRARRAWMRDVQTSSRPRANMLGDQRSLVPW